MTNNEIFLQTRLEQGLSQPQMGRALGIAARTVADFEKGRTTRLNGAAAKKFEELFGVKLDAVTGGEMQTCPENAYVNCPEYLRKCKRCGWNETVKKQRLARLARR